MTDFESTVLSELTTIREGCAVLIDHDEKCYGNGQPGWKAQHEKRLNQLERVAYIGYGGLIVILGVIKVLFK